VLRELTFIFHAVMDVLTSNDDVGVMNIRKKTVQGLTAGDTFVVTRTFTETDMHVFADITRDYNPVHFNEHFAAAKNFNGKICHGLLAASIITEIGGQIGWLASGMNFRFIKPVYFTDTVTCSFTITSIDENGRAVAEAVYKNQNDTLVLEAVITGILPNVPERDILSRMMDEGDPTNKLACKRDCD
jgi:acyl dehydratase